MTAALPPSSSTTFFLPALAFRSQPTPGEPLESQEEPPANDSDARFLALATVVPLGLLATMGIVAVRRRRNGEA